MKLATIALVAFLAVLPSASGVALGCVPSCDVDAADSGYTSPVTVMPSGESIAWRSVDNAHLTVETVAGGDTCFSAIAEGGELSERVRFDLADGILSATVYGETYACTSAIVTPDAAALLYHCLIHPTMRGAIVVTQ